MTSLRRHKSQISRHFDICDVMVIEKKTGFEQFSGIRTQTGKGQGASCPALFLQLLRGDLTKTTIKV